MQSAGPLAHVHLPIPTKDRTHIKLLLPALPRWVVHYRSVSLNTLDSESQKTMQIS